MKWHLEIMRIFQKLQEANQIVINEKEEANIYLRVEHIMKVNGQVNKEMDREYKYGLMVLNMRENGKIIKQMGRVSFGIQGEIIMKDNGKMIGLVVMEFICMPMDLNLKENG